MESLPQYIRTYTTNPDSTKPTSDSPENASTAKPQGGSSTFWLLVAITAGGAGGWYYLQQESNDPHAQVKEEEERMKAPTPTRTWSGMAREWEALVFEIGILLLILLWNERRFGCMTSRRRQQ